MAFPFGPSKQETATSEMGQWFNLRCGNPERRMSQMGHEQTKSDRDIESATAQ